MCLRYTSSLQSSHPRILKGQEPSNESPLEAIPFFFPLQIGIDFSFAEPPSTRVCIIKLCNNNKKTTHKVRRKFICSHQTTTKRRSWCQMAFPGTNPTLRTSSFRFIYTLIVCVEEDSGGWLRVRGKRINTLTLNRILCRNYTRKRKAQIHFIITRENEDIYPSMRNQYSSVFWFSDNGSDIFHPLRVSSTLSSFCLRRSRWQSP